jgi:hypothetical protein
MQLRAVPAGSTDFENPTSNVKREVLGGLSTSQRLAIIAGTLDQILGRQRPVVTTGSTTGVELIEKTGADLHHAGMIEMAVTVSASGKFPRTAAPP